MFFNALCTEKCENGGKAGESLRWKSFTTIENT
jgi:hypothetical protein